MKKLVIIIGVITSICILPLNGQYQSVVVQTPRNVSVDALRFIGTDFDSTEIAYWNYYWTNGFNCRILANSTNYYNCHGYAWYDIEGRMGQSDLRWINDVDDNRNPIYNVTKYYSGTDPSYSQVTTVTNHLKVSYFPRDHSAVTTADQDSVISKWAYGPLVKHTIPSCPFYNGSQIKYYKLIPGIIGSTSTMCNSQQRTFTSFTIIPGSTYNWSRSTSLLNYVSGSGTSSYTVQALSGPGNAYVGLQMTTPSGEVATAPNRGFWVGGAQVQSISGPSSTTINTYNYYYANTNNSSGVTWEWAVSPTGPYLSYTPAIYSALVIFYNPGYYQLRARATNVCGTTTWCPKGVNVGGKSLSLFPNPASDNVTISIKEDPLLITNDTNIAIAKTKIKGPELKNFTVRIFNSQGNLLSTTLRSGNIFSIPLTNLQDGTYLVEVSDGNNNYTQQLIIRHD